MPLTIQQAGASVPRRAQGMVQNDVQILGNVTPCCP